MHAYFIGHYFPAGTPPLGSLTSLRCRRTSEPMPIPERTTLVRTGWWWRSGDRKWTDEYLCTAPSRRSPPSRAAFPPRGRKWNNTWQSPPPLDLDKRDGERNVQRWQLCLTIIIKHEDTAGETSYGDTGEVMENAVRVQKCSKVSAWREIWSYLHCCSPPGPQQWCSGKIACRQIHPPGDLRERAKRGWGQPAGQAGPAGWLQTHLSRSVSPGSHIPRI